MTEEASEATSEEPGAPERVEAREVGPPEVDRRDVERDDGRDLLGAGVAVGAIGVLGAITGAALCPVCVIATPALLGYGAYKNIKARRARRRTTDD
ncbi:MAG: hypothetical protein HYV09_30230 [Deltaproteobacteria bacterium]|nr:hypothetical protein [Deltaproteobacteria bacterium]